MLPAHLEWLTMHAVVTGTGIDIKNKSSRSCCPGARSRPLFVPYYNLLAATAAPGAHSGATPGPTPGVTAEPVGVRLTYIHPTDYQLESIVVEIRPPAGEDSEALIGNTSPLAGETAEPGSDEFIKALVDRAPIRRRRLLVLVNPHGGPGDAVPIFAKCKPILEAAGAECLVHHTTYHGHARELVRDADLTHVDAIVCVSGDGIPHEAINGLMDRTDGAARRIPVTQIPGGSGNAMTHSIIGCGSPQLACLSILKGQAFESDLMYMTQGQNATYTFLSQSFGVVADCDLGTENLRWMGSARFTVGVLLKTISNTKYPCRIAYKRAAPPGAPATTPTTGSTPRFGSVRDEIPTDWSREVHPDLSMFYVGKMPYMSADTLVFPRTLPDDGAMDMILWDTTVGTIRGLELLDKMSRGEHVGEKDVRYEKIVAYRLSPEDREGYLSIDGESLPFEPFQVEVIPKQCLLIAPHGEYYLPGSSGAV